MRTQADALSGDVTGLKEVSEQTATALDATRKATAALEERLSGFAATTDEKLAALAPIGAQIEQLDAMVGALTARETERAASAEKALFAMEVANLQRAAESGQIEAGEIERLKQSAPADFDTAALDALAKQDVPTVADLNRRLGRLAPDIIQSETVPEDASAIDRLVANARSIVRVRRTGDVAGDSTEAIVARAEDRLGKGDLTSAVAELGKLEGRAAKTVAPWIAAAEDRLAVDRALSALQAGVKSAVTKSAN
ncbi:MAG: mitofilin family membrane protein [Planctomycetota bacterium]